MQKLEPTILVIFGATGELTSTRLLPALYRMADKNLLPEKFAIVGMARTLFSKKQFRNQVNKNLRKYCDTVSPAVLTRFLSKIYYSPGNIGNPADFQKLSEQIERLGGHAPARHSLSVDGSLGVGGCSNRLFYYATLPSHYESLSQELNQSGLLIGCKLHQRKTRVLLEKPFGRDFRSARKLDKTLHKYFQEEQIYRIDHYLGKETVQNLITTRMANSIFEPIWNRRYIDHVQISSLETVGVESRGAFYKQTGAIRDFMQNHLMQLLAHIAMEPPRDLSTNSIRAERAKVIKAVKKPKLKELKNQLAIGQYDTYRKEPTVSAKSRTETYAAVKLFIDNQRWAGVPFYLRTGKKLKNKVAEISVHFKPVAPHLFPRQPKVPNILTFRIQPNEGIFLHLAAKYPGFGIRLHPVTMELGYQAAFREEIPEAYERLLLDFMEGDQRLFARTDEIEYSWKYIDILERYIKKTKTPIYQPGTWGPKAGEKLIGKDKRQWHLTQLAS